jgi:hypothetical protein
MSQVEKEFDAACDEMLARMQAMIAQCPPRQVRKGDL